MDNKDKDILEMFNDAFDENKIEKEELDKVFTEKQDNEITNFGHEPRDPEDVTMIFEHNGVRYAAQGQADYGDTINANQLYEEDKPDNFIKDDKDTAIENKAANNSEKKINKPNKTKNDYER